MTSLEGLLAASAEMHRHLCPRQVLGVRIGVWAGDLLALELPQQDKRLIAIIETDGCAADGISVATGCRLGRRTLRVEDFGKVAATFVDTATGRALRITPRPGVRARASEFAPEARAKWEAMLVGYQRMPAEALLIAEPVRLRTSWERLVSTPGKRAVCDGCGEEILNEREIRTRGATLCRACAGQSYYRVVSEESPVCGAIEARQAAPSLRP